ncbi:von Willebrand factor A domain-containing protein 7-like [Xyrauchen texanus]|uniref:von Willebrand factor A domain-containing protein 7-like n=1 Tax=Xyrauchen texanus TaxID=154827 RepID=UPI0022428912|nr:von Willebrand factor A domain-containing protein 7-like [Xyrauchen texanus]
MQFSAPYHFDNEAFREGREIITQGLDAVKASMKAGSFSSARIRLGIVCHTVQDFYSHSNWVELGNTAPFSNLISPGLPLNNLAGLNTATCRSCDGENCSNNILPEILQQKLLTSGYFSLLSSTKPAGKCSHGGLFDRTSSSEPSGGINKDEISSSHGFLHHRAADLAFFATMDLLEDIRRATGNQAYLRLMGFRQASVLAFVFDTLDRFLDDFEETKRGPAVSLKAGEEHQRNLQSTF